MERVEVNGIEVAYERRGKGNPLVLIHGYPLDHSIWNETAKTLENDFDLVMPDLRGFGKSKTVSTSYGMGEIADDLVQLLEGLGIEKAAFAGHSMGGYVALAFARKYPSRVTGLALVSSQTAADTPERREGRYKTAVDVEEKGVGIVADAMTDKLSPSQNVRDFIRPLINGQSRGGVAGALRAMAGREDSTDLIPNFKFPVVLIHGDADELIPVDRAREVKVAFPWVHLKELSGAGHMPMMEMPGKTAEALGLLK